MNTYIIITAFFDGSTDALSHIYKECTSPQEDTYTIICADGGYSLATAAKITPDLVIGDFDSSKESIPEEIKAITLPVEKDDTDTGICVKYALAEGADRIIILGGLGGRFDHTMSNLQLMSLVNECSKKVTMIDSHNIVTLISGTSVKIKRKEAYKISLLSYSPICENVSISGVHYPLDNATLTSEFPLGVSNEFEDSEAIVSVGSGKLLVILSTDS